MTDQDRTETVETPFSFCMNLDAERKTRYAAEVRKLVAIIYGLRASDLDHLIGGDAQAKHDAYFDLLRPSGIEHLDAFETAIDQTMLLESDRIEWRARYDAQRTARIKRLVKQHEGPLTHMVTFMHRAAEARCLKREHIILVHARLSEIGLRSARLNATDSFCLPPHGSALRVGIAVIPARFGLTQDVYDAWECLALGAGGRTASIYRKPTVDQIATVRRRAA